MKLSNRREPSHCRERRHGLEPRQYRTSDIARAVGVHPNTVRLYEAWGFLPPVPRSPSGYRLYTEEHLDLMRLARTLLHFPYPGGKQPVLGLLERAKAGDLDRALQLAQAYLARVRAEQARADEASRVLERWAKSGGTSVGDAAQNDPPCSGDGDQRGAPSPGDVAEQRPRQIGETARLLAVTADMLRNWERNGLIMVPQNRQNGYRQYRSAEIARLRVIRVLRSAGYSTMAILRMLRHLDQKGDEGLRDVLDTPGPDEDVRYATDRWLSTLAEQEQRALDAIGQLDAMIRKRQSPDRTEP